MRAERLYRRIMAAFETAYLGPWEEFYDEKAREYERREDR